MFEFYSLEGARRLGEALRDFTGGKLLINVARMPIKSPVAPLEFAFLADWYFTKRGIRDKVTITYATPLAGAYSSPDSARALARLLEEKGIGLETGFATEQVLGAVGALVADGGRRLLFDLLVEIPAHRGAAFIGRSPALGDAMDFVRTDPHTLQAHRKPNLFAIGDATDVPTPKTGSVAHFESEVLTQNVLHFLAGEPLEPGFDGHGSSFVETGFEKAMMIDFNYDTEQRAGRIPFVWGPMPLLKESRLNHLGKVAFRHLYWNAVLPGYDLPGVEGRLQPEGEAGHREPTRG
jgi:sulfide:quinone oxidoreductase